MLYVSSMAGYDQRLLEDGKTNRFPHRENELYCFFCCRLLCLQFRSPPSQSTAPSLRRSYSFFPLCSMQVQHTNAVWMGLSKIIRKQKTGTYSIPLNSPIKKCKKNFLSCINIKNAKVNCVRLRESIDLFKQIVNNNFFNKSSCILFLNKKDIFLSKIKQVNYCF